MSNPSSIRLALTESVNAYPDMPTRVEDLPALADRMDDIRAANVAHQIELLRAARARGADIACLGELCTGPYFALVRDPMWRAMAEDAERGPSVTAFREAARDIGVLVVAPIYERARSGEYFNTAVVIDEGGEILGKYRKTHIPQGGNEQGEFIERFYYRESDGRLGEWPENISDNPYFPVFRTRLGRLGVAICYDRHFEGVMSALAGAGAQLIVSPAVTFGAKSERMWPLEFAVDAARHRVFIAGSNRRGVEPPWNQPYFGEALVFGPDGRVPPVDDGEGHDGPADLVLFDIDLAILEQPDPSGWNLQRDRRPDIY